MVVWNNERMHTAASKDPVHHHARPQTDTRSDNDDSWSNHGHLRETAHLHIADDNARIWSYTAVRSV